MTLISETREEMSKTCPRCGINQPRISFHRDRSKSNGRRSWCKQCMLEVQRQYRSTQNGKEAHRRGSLKYQQTERGKAAIAKYNRSEKGRIVSARSSRKQRLMHPQKVKARLALEAAVRSGRLTRGACEACGSEEKTHGHHEDYSRLLEVIWLCPRCHTARHLEVA